MTNAFQSRRRVVPCVLLAMACVTAISIAAEKTSRPAAPKGARVTKEGWFPPPESVTAKPDVPEKVEQAFVIPIHGAIMKPMYETVRRKVIQCRGKGADLVVFDLKTPGGAVDAMEDIIDLIRNDLIDVRTVAYVNNRATSAGAIIATACDDLAMARQSTIGASMPVWFAPTGPVEMPDKIRKKAESDFRSQVRTLIETDPNRRTLLEGMITLAWELWLIRDETTGELKVVRARDWRHRTRRTPATTQPVIVTRGGLAVAPARTDPKSPWVWLRTIVDGNELVSMTDREAMALAYADLRLETMDDLKKHYHIEGQFTVLTDTPGDQFVGLLNGQLIQSALFMGMLFFGFLELKTPGFGVFGSIALVCLGVLVGSRFLMGLANPIEIAAMVVGIALIGIEIFVTPGFGVPGVAGIAILLLSLLAMIIPNAPKELPIPRTNLDWGVFNQGLLSLLVAGTMAVVACVVVARYLPKLPVTNRLFLAPANVVADVPVPDSAPVRRVDVGDIGTVEGMCRPVGKVRFGDDLLDAASEGAIIPEGARVRVIRRDGNHLIVEEA